MRSALRHISVRVVEVHMWGQLVGALALDPELGYYVFAYDKKFGRGKHELAPLHMPLRDSEEPYVFTDLPEATYHRLPAMISDCLPDQFGNTLVNRYLADRGVPLASITSLDRLAYMGARGLGALEFKPSQGPKSLTALDMAKLVGEARSAVTGKFENGDDDASAALRNIIEVGTSAGGARAKAIVAWNPTTGELKSGQGDLPEGFSQWILKFDGMAPEAHIGHPPIPAMPFGRFEYAYYLMALAAGIKMSESQLLVENNRAHFLTKRFDRGQNNEKIHMQTLCAMNHLDYKKKSTNSYEQLFLTMHLLNLSRLDFIECYRRMVFNIMSRNCDDHTKNFSFLLPQSGKWKMSPAYDLTFSHNPTGEWTNQHLMSVNGKWKDFELKDLLNIADRFGIGEAKSVIEEVRHAVVRWAEFADLAGISRVQAEFISSLFLLISK